MSDSALPTDASPAENETSQRGFFARWLADYRPPGLVELAAWMLLLLINVGASYWLIDIRNPKMCVQATGVQVFSDSDDMYPQGGLLPEERASFALFASWLGWLCWGLGRSPLLLELQWCLLGALAVACATNFAFVALMQLNIERGYQLLNGYEPMPHFVWHAGTRVLLTTVLTTVWLWCILSRRPIVLRLGTAMGISFIGLATIRVLGSFTHSQLSALIWNQLCATIGLAWLLRAVGHFQLIQPTAANSQATCGHRYGLFGLFAVFTAVAIAVNIARYCELLNAPNSFRMRLAIVALMPAVAGVLAWMACLSCTWRSALLLATAAVGAAMCTPVVDSIVMPDAQQMISNGTASRYAAQVLHILWLDEMGLPWAFLSAIAAAIVSVLLRANGLRLARA